MPSSTRSSPLVATTRQDRALRRARERELPGWLDQPVEAHHADLALAILSAFVEVQGLTPEVPRTSVPLVPERANALYEPLLSDNFG